MDKINAERLVSIRKKHGYSQKYVAVTLNVAPSVVSRWESGIKCPSRESIAKLADLYGVSVDYLLGRSESAPPTGNILNADESSLLADYRRLSGDNRMYIRKNIQLLLQDQSPKEKSS